MYEQRRSRKAVHCIPIRQGPAATCRIGWEINVFGLLRGYYGHKGRKHEVIKIVVSLQLWAKPDASSMFEEELS